MEQTKELQKILAAYATQGCVRYCEELETELYNYYGEIGLIDDPKLWEYYQALRNALLLDREQILSAAEALAAYQEQRAFREGFRLGLLIGAKK